MAAVLELLLSDARTPSGSFAVSGGLEAAIGEGLQSGEVPAFVRARLRTIGRCDAALAAAATAASTPEALLALDLEAAARTPAEPLRRSARQLGRALLRTARTWWPEHELLDEYAGLSELTPRPVVLGAVAAAAGLTPLAAARASLYDDAATVAAAAVKLLPLDAAVATGWIVANAPELERLARTAVAQALPSTSTPLLDTRALDHATNARRMFAT
jgi:urease accessory protein